MKNNIFFPKTKKISELAISPMPSLTDSSNILILLYTFNLLLYVLVQGNEEIQPQVCSWKKEKYCIVSGWFS